MLTKSIQLIHILFFSILLLACGNAGIGGGESSADGSDGSSGTVPDDGTDVNRKSVIGLRIEVNDEMLASWKSDVFNALTPKKAYALEGVTERNNLSIHRISVVSLDHNFEERPSSATPSPKVDKRDEGGYKLRFNELYVEQIDLVIKVKFANDAVIYAPLYPLASESESITVNVASHYVLKKLFDTLDTPEDLDALLPCAASDCPNQFLAKAKLLQQISKTAQEYEITIPSTSDIDDALTLLDRKVDFRTHIEAAVAEISRDTSPISKGTPRAFAITDGSTLSRLTTSTQYNSLWFAISLNNLLPENENHEVLIATETSIIVPESKLGNTLPIYPNYNQTTYLFDTRTELLTSDIPFTRTNLSIAQNTAFTLKEPNNDPDLINSFSSLLSDSYTSTEGFILNERIVEQAIPQAETVGWQFNPLFSNLYHANEYEPDDTTGTPDTETPDYGVSPTWLLGSNYNTGGSFELTKNNDKFERGSQIEDLNIFSWEIHGQETDTSFSINQLNDKTYGVINYSLNLEDGSFINKEKILELFAETEQWNINGGTVSISQPSTHYRSYTLKRDKDNAVQGVNEVNNISATSHSISTVKTNESSQEAPSGKEEIQGLLTLDGGAFAPIGHSTQDGKHLAFVFQRGFGKDNEDRGRGITIATELRSQTATPRFSEEGDRYKLLGNSFGITTAENSLKNLNNSILILTDENSGSNECHATLQESSSSLTHTVGDEIGENTLSAPASNSLASITSTTCNLSGGEIEMIFTDNNSKQLTLKGFVSPQDKNEVTSSSTVPGNVITLLWVQDDNLGLVFANRDQQLSPTFD